MAPGSTAWTRTFLPASSLCSDWLKRHHIRLARTVDAVEDFRRDGDDRGDVDDGAAAAGDQARRRRIGETGERPDIERDHVVHRIDIGVEQRRHGRNARIVDQHRDAGVGAQPRFDAPEIGLVVEIRGDDVDAPAGLVGELLCQIVEALAVARHQDQIVAAPGEAIGIDGADA